jgi:hypothetical protein
MYDKEKVYDEEIAPLMSKIIEICKRENLAMASQFYLQEEFEDAEYEGPMYCTTVICPEGDTEGHDQIKHVAGAMIRKR